MSSHTGGSSDDACLFGPDDGGPRDSDAVERITAIRADPRRPQLMTIRVGRRRVATLSAGQVSDLGLGVGDPWDAALAERVAGAERYRKCYKDAMARLNRRAMSRRMLADKLRAAGHEQTVREAVLDRLTELGVLDDEAFARSLVREATLSKPAGPRLLRGKLRAKGVSGDVTERVVASMRSTEDDLEAARRLAAKRASSMARLAPDVRKRRLYGLLVRRGFEPEVVDQVLRETSDFEAGPDAGIGD